MDCVWMKLEIMMTQFIVTYVKWNHSRCLTIDAEQYEKFKKDPLPWYYPNCAMEIPFSTLSNKDLKTVLFVEGSFKTLEAIYGFSCI